MECDVCYPFYEETVASCAYDEHENDVYFLGDAKEYPNA